MVDLEILVDKSGATESLDKKNLSFRELLELVKTVDSSHIIPGNASAIIKKLSIDDSALISLYDRLMGEGVEIVYNPVFTKEEEGHLQNRHYAKNWLFNEKYSIFNELLFELYSLAKKEHEKKETLIEFANKPVINKIFDLAYKCSWDDDHHCNVANGWRTIEQDGSLMYNLRNK